MSTAIVSTGIGFIGAGQMATALARGFLAAKVVAPERIIASDVSPDMRSRFTASTAARTVDSNSEVARHCDVLFLAVKPQHMPPVLRDLKGQVNPRQVIVSIAAGVSLATIGAALSPDLRLIRVMPNTPALIGAGASAYALGGSATDDDGRMVETLLSTVGRAVRLPEKLLDAVTGLSGSGPAYVYVMIEALSDGGVRMRLPRDVATQLAAQTVLGAARMVLESGQHPGALKDAVASPGGTTIAGLHALERGGLRGTLMDAVQAATQRSEELGRPAT